MLEGGIGRELGAWQRQTLPNRPQLGPNKRELGLNRLDQHPTDCGAILGDEVEMIEEKAALKGTRVVLVNV